MPSVIKHGVRPMGISHYTGGPGRVSDGAICLKSSGLKPILRSSDHDYGIMEYGFECKAKQPINKPKQDQSQKYLLSSKQILHNTSQIIN